ncbi:hypothetical protein [Marisediminicola antarctica]|uniref:DNA polymerase III subunit gamma/tau n=1 Tax=Marisediminicola antarctica TaxID=674079 RepID=A0A7L5AQV5_9MICO|nr:hypothetical protein [Marisediminicola antarctica]QHO70759.1 hypothetical protein BHD05_15000 [Marisediminicola antarctica]
MASDRDDDALTWGGESDDPSYLDGAGSTAPADVAESEPSAPASATASALLVAYGIFGGVYLLYLIGWVISVQRDTFTASGLFFEIMYQLGEFLAIVSPAIWFGLVLLLTRGGRPALRVAWLVAGIVLLAPWPFILGSVS